MDPIKEAFSKIKEDMNLLKQEIELIRQELNEIQLSIVEFIKTPIDKQTDKQIYVPTDNQTPIFKKQTVRQIITTDSNTPTHPSTDKYQFKAFKTQNINISTGNDGVPTDRQTDRQTNNSTRNKGVFYSNKEVFSSNYPDPAIVLSQLDSIKKDLRLKIKRLTNQEMLVLSLIYQFEDQGYLVDYPLLSQQLHLSESSIRDYIKRIISKGVLVVKEKVNNKRIVLHISSDLRKLASLDTLLSLREI